MKGSSLIALERGTRILNIDRESFFGLIVDQSESENDEMNLSEEVCDKLNNKHENIKRGEIKCSINMKIEDEIIETSSIGISGKEFIKEYNTENFIELKDIDVYDSYLSKKKSCSNSKKGFFVHKKDKTELYKTELCKSYLKFGFCRYSNMCQFAHNQMELRNVFRHPRYKSEVCKTFSMYSDCPYGDRCCFIHEGKIQQKVENVKEEFESKKEIKPVIFSEIEKCCENSIKKIRRRDFRNEKMDSWKVIEQCENQVQFIFENEYENDVDKLLIGS